MNARALLLVSALLGVVFAVRPVVRGAEPGPSEKPEGPARIHVRGPYTHPGSKMEFPEQIGEFKRVEITRFDAAERDVGVGYNGADAAGVIVVTAYVYPAPKFVSVGSPPEVVELGKALLFRKHFEAVKAAVLARHRDIKVESDDEFVLTEGGRKHKGRKAVFDFPDDCPNKGDRSLSWLYLFEHGEWLIKYRVTFPKAAKERAPTQIDELMAALKWPKVE